MNNRIRLLLSLCALTLLFACAPLRVAKRAFAPYKPTAECARKTLMVKLHIDCPKAFWSVQGGTYCAECDPDKGARSVYYCDDPPFAECDKR
jgi:hypothetical protein